MKLTTDIFGAIRTAVLSILLCCVVYTLVIWTIAQVFVPNSANGSLVKNAAGQYVGSNLTPTSPKITERAQELIKKYGATAENPIPADMVTASGSGLDPHITLAAAKFQAPRVAKARGMSEAELMKVVESKVEYPGGIMRNEPIVNVLMLNLALDEMK